MYVFSIIWTTFSRSIFEEMTQSIKYEAVWVRSIVALIGALVVVNQGQWSLLIVSFGYTSTYIALGGSFIMAFLLISYIRWTYLVLDPRISWHEDWPARTVLQLILGVAVPTAVDMAVMYLVTLYTVGYTDWLKFLEDNLPIVIILLLLLNASYTAWNVLVIAINGRREMSPVNNDILDSDIRKSLSSGIADSLPVMHGGIRIMVRTADILFCFKNEQQVVIVTRAGRYTRTTTVKEIYSKLDDKVFFLVGRSLIIRLSTIESHRSNIERRTIEFNLKEEYSGYLDRHERALLSVPRKRRDAFISEFERVRKDQ